MILKSICISWVDLGIRVWVPPPLIRAFTTNISISSGTLEDLMHKNGVHDQITVVNVVLKQVNHNIYLVDEQSF